jgi:hypothetical protein
MKMKSSKFTFDGPELSPEALKRAVGGCHSKPKQQAKKNQSQDMGLAILGLFGGLFGATPEPASTAVVADKPGTKTDSAPTLAALEDPKPFS